MQSMGERREFY